MLGAETVFSPFSPKGKNQESEEKGAGPEERGQEQPQTTPFDFMGFSPPPPPPPEFAGEIPGSDPSGFASLEPKMMPVGLAFRDRLSQPASSIWDIFDLQLEKYVTPIILRMYWSWILVSAALAIVCLTALLLDEFGFFPNRMPRQGSAASSQEHELETVRSPDMTAGVALIGESSRLPRLSLDVLAYLAGIYLIASSVLAARVVIESMVVLFNVANHVRQIERNTRPQPRM